MKYYIPLAVIIIYLCSSFGPPNRNLYKKDPACYAACLLAENAIEFGQGSKASQEFFDQSIDSCPSFAYSYYEKAVPYAKRGQMHLWKQMIDHAVKHEPTGFLGHRAWYHHIFTGNSRAAIADIDKLERMIDHDLGPCGNGEYHLGMIRALAYKALGSRDTAITLMEDLLYSPDAEPFNYDFLHLGVLYLEAGRVDEALKAFDEQTEIYEWASNQYHRAMAQEVNGESSKALESMRSAKALYTKGVTMDNPYMHRADRIYLSDIERELERLEKGTM